MLTALLIVALASAADTIPTAAEVEAFEQARVITPYASPTRDGGYVAEFAPSVAVRNAACEKTERARVYRCRFESQVSDWGRTDGPWTAREVLIRRDRKGCWREVI